MTTSNVYGIRQPAVITQPPVVETPVVEPVVQIQAVAAPEVVVIPEPEVIPVVVAKVEKKASKKTTDDAPAVAEDT